MTAETTQTGQGLGRAAPDRTRRLGLALVVISMAQLMLVLDELIVNTALPHIQQALHFSGTGLEWVVTGYAVTFGGLLLLGGRAGDILGRRRMFSAGIGIFTLASLLGGFATHSWLLITARVLQGTGAALAAPAALSLIAVTFPEGKPRTRALAVYAAMTGMGGGVGLIAGGLLTTSGADDHRGRSRPGEHVLARPCPRAQPLPDRRLPAAARLRCDRWPDLRPAHHDPGRRDIR